MPELKEKLIRIREASERYFGGQMSVQWWRDQVTFGNLPHYRAGQIILLRVADVEAFVARSFHAARVKPGGMS